MTTLISDKNYCDKLCWIHLYLYQENVSYCSMFGEFVEPTKNLNAKEMKMRQGDRELESFCG